MRAALDGLYRLGGALAAALIVAICLVVSAQVVLNLVTKLGLFGLVLTIPSYADFAGYFLSASTFLALAYTLTRGGHIRVTLATRALPPRARLVAELFALAVAAGATLMACLFVFRLVRDSFSFGDRSGGIIAIPLWIPQGTMLAGLALLALALCDLLVRTALTGQPQIADSTSE